MSKIIPKIEKENGEIISKQNDILTEAKQFYKTMYENKEGENGCTVNELEKDMQYLNFKRLSMEEKLGLEGEITVCEAGVILKNMNNNKSPGTDGFTTEFFKFF